VQFVEFKQAAMKGDLAEQVLKEVPSQFMQFMQAFGIMPPQPTSQLPGK
jgi:hypothetical protein